MCVCVRERESKVSTVLYRTSAKHRHCVISPRGLSFPRRYCCFLFCLYHTYGPWASTCYYGLLTQLLQRYYYYCHHHHHYHPVNACGPQPIFPYLPGSRLTIFIIAMQVQRSYKDSSAFGFHKDRTHDFYTTRRCTWLPTISTRHRPLGRRACVRTLGNPEHRCVALFALSPLPPQKKMCQIWVS